MDISNKTLAFFLIAAIVVSVVGTMTSLNKIDRFQREGPSGLATSDTGNVSLFVNRSASIIFKNTTINWGSGSINGTSNNCTMDTKGAGSVASGDCVDFTAQPGLHIENNGNLDVDITFNFSGNNTVINTAGSSGITPEWQFNVTNDLATASCDSATGSFGPVGEWVDINGSMVTSGYDVCQNFSWEPGQDRIRIDFRVVVPSDTMSGTKNITLLAEATPIET